MERALVRRALEALGIRRLVLAVHDASLPGDAADDLGRGAPLSRGGLAFLRFAAGLGFDGLQLGPQGETSEIDPSPYDGTIFSRSTLAIAAGPLVARGLLSAESFAAAVAARPPGAGLRAQHRHVFALQRRLLDEAFARAELSGAGTQARAAEVSAARAPDLADPRARAPELADSRARAPELADSRARAPDAPPRAPLEALLDRDALYQALAAEHREPDWLRWPQADRELFAEDAAADARDARIRHLRARHALLLRRFHFAQRLAHEQHQAFKAEAAALRLRLYGDLQIGIGHQDIWALGALFLPGLRMGAPPSRTNPAGQPWSYAVLRRDAPALAFLRARVGKLFSEFDGLRIDHPHGLIDPWVYAAAQPDGPRAVQQGARLCSSPDRPELALHAIARPDQLDPAQPRYADGWVRELDAEQVERYALLFDGVVAAAKENGREVRDLVCEVLSTQPYPVARVLQRHGLGRFRVTQKAALDDPRDVYRGENAQPADWIMAGNHDTAPIWSVAERWFAAGTARAQAEYLATRLRCSASEIGRDPASLASAKLAELFVGPARNVMVFFPDLLGMREIYNRPGVVSDENWSLRVPEDFAARYAGDRRAGRALDLPRALALALRARGAEDRDLMSALTSSSPR
jgi:4-alpha-glucanotransferase